MSFTLVYYCRWRLVSPTMARRKSHRRRSRASRRGLSSFRHVRRGFASSKLWNSLATLSGIGALFAQATSADIKNFTTLGGLSTAWKSATGTQKATALAVCFIQRITNGMVLGNYSATLGTSNWTLNSKPTWAIGNVFNGFTFAGIAALIYKHVPKMPQRGKVGKFALPLLAGGIIGGLLDDPTNQAVSRSNAYLGVLGAVNSPQVNLRGQSTTNVNKTGGGL